MKNQLCGFSCVIMTAKDPNNLDEWVNIKNPYGVEPFHLMISEIKLALIACTITPIVRIIFDVSNLSNKKHTKIVLNQEQLVNMDKDEIGDYLEKEVIEKILY